MLSEENLKQREGKFTASMGPAIMSGDPEMIMEQWRRAIGEIGEQEQNWPMKVGEIMEKPVIDWHQEKTGERLTERGVFVPHPTLELVSCTLDCYRASTDTVIDAKVCTSWNPIEDIIKFYTPQILIQQRCRGAANGALLIMHGLAEPKEYPVEFNEEYERVLWERVAAFQLCVTTLTPPVPQPKIVPPDQWRIVNLGEEYRDDWPNWAPQMIAALEVWREHQYSANAFNAAVKQAKELIPDDVGKIEFEDILMTRNRAGALSIKEVRR